MEAPARGQVGGDGPGDLRGWICNIVKVDGTIFADNLGCEIYSFSTSLVHLLCGRQDYIHLL